MVGSKISSVFMKKCIKTELYCTCYCKTLLNGFVADRLVSNLKKEVITMKVFNDVAKINLRNVKYGKGYMTPTKGSWNVYFQESSSTTNNGTPRGDPKAPSLKSIFIVSPKVVVAWDKTYNATEKTFNIEFYEEWSGSSGSEESFMSKLEGLFHKMVDKLCKTLKRDINGGANGERNQITTKDSANSLGVFKVYPNKSVGMRFYNVRTDQIRVFNEQENEIEIEDVIRDDEVKLLFHVKSIWLSKDNNWGINVQLVQMMRVRPYEDIHVRTVLGKERTRCLNGMASYVPFHGETSKSIPTGATVKESIVTKYRKMKTIGIPDEAIRQRINGDFEVGASERDVLMNLLGLSVVSSSTCSTTGSSSAAPPPCPPPPPSPPHPLSASNVASSTSTMFCPSQSALLAARKNLKKAVDIG